MSIKIKNIIKTPILLLLAVSLIIASLYFIQKSYKKENRATETKNINIAAPTQEEKDQVEKFKTDTDTKSATIPSPTPNNNQKAIIISAIQDLNSKSLVVQTKLVGLNWKSCTLVLTNGEVAIEKKSGIIYQADFSTCLGYTIPIDEITIEGKWDIRLIAMDDKDSKIESQTVSVNIVR